MKQVCLASEMHEPYLMYTKIPAFASHEYLESRRSCLARNAHEGCQIHGMIPARRVLQETVQISCFTLQGYCKLLANIFSGVVRTGTLINPRRACAGGLR